MNKQINDVQKESHGSAQSYAIGFIISLFLTFQAYYLVTDKTFTGNTLLAMILGLAFIQMAVQIFFFLHLGRGPKPLYNIVFFGGTMGLILIVVVGSIFIMNNLQYNMAPSEVTQKLSQDEAIAAIGGVNTGACKNRGKNHKIVIKNDKVSPSNTKAKLCDTLSFINEDSVSREITFGPHPEHRSYGGETEINVRKKSAKTITLNQVGSHIFHDHLDETVTGNFTVTR